MKYEKRSFIGFSTLQCLSQMNLFTLIFFWDVLSYSNTLWVRTRLSVLNSWQHLNRSCLCTLVVGYNQVSYLMILYPILKFKNIVDFLKSREIWLDNPLIYVDADTIEPLTNDYYKTIIKCIRTFADLPKVQYVANVIRVSVGFLYLPTSIDFLQSLSWKSYLSFWLLLYKFVQILYILNLVRVSLSSVCLTLLSLLQMGWVFLYLSYVEFCNYPFLTHLPQT